MKKLIMLAAAMLLSGCSALLSGPQCLPNPEKAVLRVVRTEQAAVVHFADGKSDLNAGDLQLVKNVAARAISEQAKVVVYGHASHRTRPVDPIQKILINLEVSNDRAIKVSQVLAAEGVAAEDIHPVALFDSRPVRKEITRADEAANRRAEIYLYWFE